MVINMYEIERNRLRRYSDTKDIQSICDTISICMNTIKVCDTLVKDNRGLYPKDGNRATLPILRAALGINYPGKPPNGTKGEILPNGDVVVSYPERGHMKDLAPIPGDEIERRLATGLYSSNKGQFKLSQNSLIGVQGQGIGSTAYNQSPNVFKPTSSQGGINSVQAAQYANASGNKILLALTTVASAVALVAGVINTIDAVSGKMGGITKAASSIFDKIRKAREYLSKAKTTIKTEEVKTGDISKESRDILKDLDEQSNRLNALEQSMSKMQSQLSNNMTKKSEYDIQMENPVVRTLLRGISLANKATEMSNKRLAASSKKLEQNIKSKRRKKAS